MLTTPFSALFSPSHSYKATFTYEGENDEKIFCSITTLSSPLHFRIFRAASEILNIGLGSKTLIFIGGVGFWLKRRTIYSALLGGALGMLARCVYSASQYLFDRMRLNRALEISSIQILPKEKILEDVNLLYHLHKESAKNPSANKWCTLVSHFHAGEKNALDALVNDYLLSNCTGLTCALLIAAKTWGRSPGPILMQNIKRIEVVWYQFKAILASPLCLLSGNSRTEEARNAFMKQNEADLNKIKVEAEEGVLNPAAGIILHSKSFHFKGKKADHDLRMTLSKVIFIQSLESRAADIEKEKGSALICARVVFSYRQNSHTTFVQFNGGYYRFCCSKEGMFAFPSRAAMLEGLFGYMRNINFPIQAIEIYFYTM